MTVLDEFRTMLKNSVGPLLRSRGFKGSSPTWILTAERGDRALINVQRSTSTSAAEVRFTINLAIIPEPWFAFRSKIMVSSSTPDVAARWARRRPNSSDGLWEDRLAPDCGWWTARTSSELEAARVDVSTRLAEEAVPLLTGLAARENLIATVRAGDLGLSEGEGDYLFRLAVLLADEGHVDDANQAIEGYLAAVGPQQIEGTNTMSDAVTWIRQRAAEVARSRSGASPRDDA